MTQTMMATENNSQLLFMCLTHCQKKQHFAFFSKMYTKDRKKQLAPACTALTRNFHL